MKFSNLHLFLDRRLLPTLSLPFDSQCDGFCTISTLYTTAGPPILPLSATEPRMSLTFPTLQPIFPRQLHLPFGLGGSLDAAVGGKRSLSSHRWIVMQS
jgi:hypothetical protein